MNTINLDSVNNNNNLRRHNRCNRRKLKMQIKAVVFRSICNLLLLSYELRVVHSLYIFRDILFGKCDIPTPTYDNTYTYMIYYSVA